MYYGKLLLFGEYSIVVGSKGLAIPFRRYSGTFDFSVSKSMPKKVKDSHNTIVEFGKYIELTKSLNDNFNNILFEEDIKRKIYFNSNIPEGYGAGSSGALVAAVYDKYFNNNETNRLTTLALLENFFHGKSSGYDPLVSLLNKTILIEENSYRQIDVINKEPLYQFFLIDTGIKRKTKGFVNNFLTDFEDDKYKSRFNENYVLPVNSAINALIQNEAKELLKAFKSISEYQNANWQKLIPNNIQTPFKYGLETNKFYLKLCGAGGGGFFIGLTTDMNYTESYFKSRQLPVYELVI